MAGYRNRPDDHVLIEDGNVYDVTYIGGPHVFGRIETPRPKPTGHGLTIDSIARVSVLFALLAVAVAALTGCAKHTNSRYVTAMCRDPATLQAFPLDTRRVADLRGGLTQGYARIPLPGGRSLDASDEWVAANCWDLQFHERRKEA